MTQKCPNCAYPAPDEATNCPSCRASLREVDVPSAPAGGGNVSEPLTPEQLNALYVGKNWNRFYKPRFDRFAAKGGRFQATWNWAAALVPFWYLYRKLWLPFFGWYGLNGVLSVVVNSSYSEGLRDLSGGVVVSFFAWPLVDLFLGSYRTFAAVAVAQGVCGNFLLFRRAQRVDRKSVV